MPAFPLRFRLGLRRLGNGWLRLGNGFCRNSLFGPLCLRFLVPGFGRGFNRLGFLCPAQSLPFVRFSLFGFRPEKALLELVRD
jgi:hypothetical protein